MSDMEYKKFSTFIDSVQYGYTADETSTVEGDAKYLRITDIVPYFVDKDRVPFCKISDKNRIKYLVTENDLLIARTGATTGYNLIVPKGFDNYVFASYLVRFNYNQDELYPQYLKHVLKSQQYYGFVKNYIGGSAQPGMNPKAFGRFEVPHVEYDKQKRIAEILSAYDDLIENNNRRIALLEKAAQELYKEWFVRFRFPGYENAKFENGLPEGWEIKKIGDIARIKSGYAFKSEWWTDEGVPVIKIKDIQNNTIDFGDLSRVSEENALLAKQFFVTEGDLLIAMTGATIGKLALVPFSSEKLVVNQRVGKFFLGDNPIATVPFLYCTLQQNWIQEMIIMIASSNAAQPNISPFDIEKIKVVYSKKIVDAFNERASKFINQILLLQKRNQNLAKQRDLLLPRLMSGQLEV